MKLWDKKIPNVCISVGFVATLKVFHRCSNNCLYLQTFNFSFRKCLQKLTSLSSTVWLFYLACRVMASFSPSAIKDIIIALICKLWYQKKIILLF